MTVEETRSFVKQKFPTVQPSYNKLWRGRELAIVDIFNSWERSYEMLPSLLAAIQDVYKDYHMKKVKTLFKQAARHKKS
jgi:hypothetical protein